MSGGVPVRSDRCGLEELFVSYETGDAERSRLALGPGRPQQWTATWQVPNGDEVSLVRDLGLVPVAGCGPVRRFSWGRRQRHRPGLQFMVSTGRVHGFESLEEQSLLLALDFTGAVEDVLPQPFTLRFGAADGRFRRHVPDFLAVFRDGSRWLFDVRPARLAGEDDATCFAAAAEAALLGLGSVSERTLRRMAGGWKDRGPAGCIDGRWLRPRTGHPGITGEVREAIFAVRKETRDRSRTSVKDKHVLVAQYVAEKFGADVPVPGYWTLKKVALPAIPRACRTRGRPG